MGWLALYEHALREQERAARIAHRKKRREERRKLHDGVKADKAKLRKRECGARTRRGTQCIREALANGRYPNHGGLSTGPKTKAGKKRIADAQKKRWANLTAQRELGGTDR